MLSRRYIVRMICLAAVCLICRPAAAWLRCAYEDLQVVERSTLIVIGHMDVDSIVYTPPEGRSGINRFKATLVVTDVLKGDFKGKQLTFFINHGLTPVVGGYLKTPSMEINLRGDDKDYPQDKVTIMDTGSWGGVVAEDATNDHVWFLRYLTGELGRDVGGNELGIVDPEDIQSAALKDYFTAYLADDPEQALEPFAANTDDSAPRAQRYLDHLAIQRALELEDPKARIEALVPYAAARSTWELKQEAVDGIIACGDMAGPELLRLFDAPEHRADRLGIMKMWAGMKYDGCVEALILLLESSDEFWAKQEPIAMWWPPDGQLTGEKRQRFEEVRAAVTALAAIHDPRAEAVLELTKKRWTGIEMTRRSIDHICQDGLERIRKQRDAGND